ncbi:MAG: sigma-70 family RNA polymerase sigma factor [bacterium]|nr:sigma-70 family RNA polymerase sigma factor [bacterium]
MGAIDDTSEIAATLKGDDTRFGKLVERHFAPVRALCAAHLGNRSDADDAAQEAFVRCYEQLHRLRNPEKFPGWLMAIARNVCRTRLRKARQETSLIERYRNGVVREEDHGASPDRQLMSAEFAGTVHALIQDLPRKTREAVALHYLEGQSIREIAVYLNTSPNAVARLLKYGREKMKDRLWREGIDSFRAFRRGSTEEGIRKTCAAIPLGQAAWCLKGGTGAVTASTVAAGGVLVLKSKLIIGGAAVAIIGFFVVLHNLLGSGTATGEPGAGPPVLSPAAVVEDTAPERAIREDSPSVVSAREETAPMPRRAAADTAPVPEESLYPVRLPEGAFAEVWGHVMDTAGVPVGGADVTVMAFGVPEGTPPTQEGVEERAVYLERFWDKDAQRPRASFAEAHSFSGRTDGKGAFRVSGIPFEGLVSVQARADGYIQEEPMGLAVKAGDPRKVLIRMCVGRPVQGRVLDGAGRRLADATVRVLGMVEARGARIPDATTGADGTFTLWVREPGQACLSVESDREGAATFAGLHLDPGQLLELRYPAKATLTGYVRSGSGRALGRVTVRLKGALSIHSDEGRHIMTTSAGSATYEAETGSTGRYLIEGIDPAQEYEAEVVGVAGAVLAESEKIGLLPGGERTIRNFVVQDAIQARGVVFATGSRRPLPRVRVSASPRSVSGSSVRAETDDQGRFEMTLLTGPGDYAFRPSYLRAGVSASVAEKAYVRVVALPQAPESMIELDLPEGWIARFRLVDTDGNPVPGVDVVVDEKMPGAKLGYEPELVHRDGNEMVISGLAPDSEFTFRFSHRAYAPMSMGPYVGAPGDDMPVAPVVLYPLSKASGVTGRLLGPDGAPVVENRFGVILRYPNGSLGKMGGHTDGEGFFLLSDNLPGVKIDMTFVFSNINGKWAPHEARSTLFLDNEDGVADLGDIVVSGVE